jgi:hypothetical protein
MPNWKKLIVSGSNAILSSVTASNGFFGTASWATNAITASYALSSPGGGGSPGGTDTYIQFNSQSAFGGSINLTYTYDTTSQQKYRLYHEGNVDFRTTPFTVDYPASYYQVNLCNALKQHAGISHYQYSMPISTGATSIYLFDAQGGTPGNLSMQGFKCDYSLLIRDGSLNKVASRVGTLLGAWSYDTSTPPVLQDTYVNGDSVFNELGLVVFTLSWSGTDISLDMDATGTSAGYDIIFNGLFTNFGNSV